MLSDRLPPREGRTPPQVPRPWNFQILFGVLGAVLGMTVLGLIDCVRDWLVNGTLIRGRLFAFLVLGILLGGLIGQWIGKAIQRSVDRQALACKQREAELPK
jgi:uncharacterized membrane protein YraQ (UPF0718 family)